MADGRMLKRKTSWDPRVAELSDRSALLYVLAIPHLDIEGRMIGLPVHLRGNVVPLRPWSDNDVESYIIEWTVTKDEDGAVRPLVLWYACHGVTVCQFTGFTSNQHLRRDRERPSVLPPPPDDLLSPLTMPILSDKTTPMPLGEPLFGENSGSSSGSKAEAEEEKPLLQSRLSTEDSARHQEPAALANESFEDWSGRVARKSAAAQRTSSSFLRLLEVLPDRDENSQIVLRRYLDGLPAHAPDVVREELLAGAGVIRRPTAYAVGILKRWAEQGHRGAAA